MIKVLYVVDGTSYGGIAKLCNDIKNNISKEIIIDIITSNNICNDWYNLGVSRNTLLGKIKYNNRLNKFLKKNKYDIVHINSGVFLFTLQVSRIAKKNKIKTVIAHSHSIPHCSWIKKKIISLLRPLFNKYIDIKLACSTDAAKSLFNNTSEATIINNGIVVNDYKYSELDRVKYRKIFGIDKQVVYGYAGAFTKNKNHELLIKVFNEFLKKQDAILMFVGDGPNKYNIQTLVNELNITDKVLFLGSRSDSNKIYNVMDVFVFPSIREGFGLVAIEAQTNGLLTWVSNTIPKEVNISPLFKQFNINDDIKSIADTIYCDKIDVSKREYAYKYIKDSDFDIKNVCKKIENIYHNVR